MAHSHAKESEIPIIDISSPTPETAKEVLDAASKHGFLFIENDGVTIPPEDIDAMFELSRKFFHSPVTSKSEYSVHSPRSGGKNRGWVSMSAESLDPEGQKHGDPKEAFNIAEPTVSPPQPLPTVLEESREFIQKFQRQCHELCMKVLGFLAEGLEVEEAEGDKEWFKERHDQSEGSSGTIFRLLYYPATKKSEGSGDDAKVLAGAHSDYGSVTLLFRLPGQPGLEILTPEQTWVPVPVNPSPSTLGHPPILVNIGDLLSFWTKGLLRSTVHRVVEGDSRQERYSIAYFCHPLDGAKLDPVPSERIKTFDSGENVQRERRKLGFNDSGEGADEVLTARQHLDRRLKVTYGLKE